MYCDLNHFILFFYKELRIDRNDFCITKKLNEALNTTRGTTLP